MEMPWKNGDIVQEYEEFIRKNNEEVIGKIHLVYEFTDFKKKNLLDSISQSTII